MTTLSASPFASAFAEGLNGRAIVSVMTFQGTTCAIVGVLATITTCAVGCGLSLTTDPASPTKTDASTDAPVSPDAPIPPRPELAFTSETALIDPSGLPVVTAAEEESSTKLLSLAHEAGKSIVSEVGAPSFLYSFGSAGAPSSFAPFALPAAPSSPRALFALPANGGLFATFEDGSAPAFGDRTDASRVKLAGGRVYLGTSLDTSVANGTKIVSCPLGFPQAPNTCAGAPIVYDSQELGGFTVSKNGLLLVGLVGQGESLQLAAFSRTSVDAPFATPKPLPVKSGSLTDAEELVTVRDDASELRFRGPCRANEAAVVSCVVTLTR